MVRRNGRCARGKGKILRLARWGSLRMTALRIVREAAPTTDTRAGGIRRSRVRNGASPSPPASRELPPLGEAQGRRRETSSGASRLFCLQNLPPAVFASAKVPVGGCQQRVDSLKGVLQKPPKRENPGCDVGETLAPSRRDLGQIARKCSASSQIVRTRRTFFGILFWPCLVYAENRKGHLR